MGINLRKFFIIIACFFMYGCDEFRSKSVEPDRPKSAQRFQMAIDKTGNAWRWDVETGETWKCWEGSPGFARPTCYPMYLGQ